MNEARLLLPSSAWRATWAPPRLAYVAGLSVVALGYIANIVMWQYRYILLGWYAAAAILVVFWACGLLRVRRSLWPFVPLALFYMYLLLTSLRGYSPGWSTRWWIIDLAYPLTFLIAYVWAVNVSIERLAMYFEMICLVVITIAFYFLATRGTLMPASAGSFRSMYALLFSTAIPVLFWRALAYPRPWTWLLLIVSAVAALVVGSRAALLSVPVWLVGCIVIHGTLTGRPRRTTLNAIGIVLSAALVVISVPQLRAGVSAGLDRLARETSLNVGSAVEEELARPREERIDIDRRLQVFVAAQAFFQSPWLGHGYMALYPIFEDQYGRGISAHGLPSTLFAESGIVGALLFMFAVAIAYVRLRRWKNTQSGRVERAFGSALLFTLTSVLLFGLFYQVHQDATLFIVMGWANAPMRS
jgi:hypothetical protein